MAVKSSGNPCDVFREHVLLNNSSFSGSPTSSDWPQVSGRWGPSPARATASLADTTDYSSIPIEDSWDRRLHGSGSPANANGSQRGGNQT